LTGWRIDIRSDASVAEAKAAASREATAAPAVDQVGLARETMDDDGAPVPATEAAQADTAVQAEPAAVEAAPKKPRATRAKAATPKPEPVGAAVAAAPSGTDAAAKKPRARKAKAGADEVAS